ncbi:MAG: folylpolyglutamate synthase/dihydrofolate synthase family protein [Candidatus Korobacteraceae bacterium]
MLAYQTAVQELYQLGHELHKAASYKFDLKHMRVLCEALDSPHTRFPSVLIAGTNGKGSTAATLASILRTAGYRTGLFTSPHLVRINERIQIDGNAISDADFAAGYECVHAVATELVANGRLPWHPSFFETITALAFRHFAKQRVDIVVAEVGMGGRLDATNILEPLVCVVTDIDLDHQKFLGNTIREIAGEKAGIMRRGRPLVMLPQHPEANETLGQAMEETGAVPVNAARYVAAVSHPSDSEKTVAGDPGSRRGFTMDIMGEEVEIETPLLGRHQLRNLALAISAAEELVKQGWAISARQIAEGIRLTRWPGRFQIVPPEADGSRPELVIDVAHNPAGAWALRAGLSEYFAPGSPLRAAFARSGVEAAGGPVERKLILIYGAMRDKAIRDVGRILFPLAEKVVLTRAGGNPRAATILELMEAVGDCGTPLVETPSVADALRQAMAEAQPFGPRALLVITGSIYVVGEAMQALGIRP